MQKRVLCLLADGVEELELVAPVDVLRRAGAEVVLAVLQDDLAVIGRHGLVLQGEVPLEGFDAADFTDVLQTIGAKIQQLQSAQDFVLCGQKIPTLRSRE